MASRATKSQKTAPVAIALDTAAITKLARTTASFAETVGDMIAAKASGLTGGSMASAASALVTDLSGKVEQYDAVTVRSICSKSSALAVGAGSVKDARKVVLGKANRDARRMFAKGRVTVDAFIGAAVFPSATTGTLTGGQVTVEVASSLVKSDVSKAATLAASLLIGAPALSTLSAAQRNDVDIMRGIVMEYLTGATMTTRDDAYRAATAILVMLGAAKLPASGGRPSLTLEQRAAKIRALAEALAASWNEANDDATDGDALLEMALKTPAEEAAE